MLNFCAVCFLAVALCLVVCVSASTTVSKTDATREVTAAKQSVTDVCTRAQSELNMANGLLDKVESSKREATDAKVTSQKAPQDNTDAVAIANTIKSLSDDVDTLYATEKQKLEEAIKGLNTLLSDARKLEGKTDITIEPDKDSTEDYTVTNGKAAALKLEATALNGQITAEVQLIAGADTTANNMEQKAKEAQRKDSHVSAIVAVATIETMLGNADTTIGQIEGKKNEVSVIVGEMKTLKTKHPTVSDNNINVLLQNADNALTGATGAVDNAKRAKADIQKQKDLADVALTKVKAETNDVSKAKNEATTAEDCVTAAERIVLQLETALQTAKDSVTTAIDSQQKLKKNLSTTTTEQNTQQTKEKEETNLPAADGTDSHQKDTTIKPTSKDSPDQSNNNTDKLKDALIKSAQNMPTTALTGGKAPAPGAKNDSAMTVSVPLLVALIASAVLQ